MRPERPLRPILALAVAALLASGCLDDRSSDEGSEPGPSALPAGVRVFSGLVPFGQNATDAPGRAPAGFGVAGSTYVSGYGPEPNIGVTSSGAIFTSAFSTVMRSTDAGATWQPVHTHSVPGVSTVGVGDNNDPMLWVDPWTDTVYNAPMFPILLCASIYASTDDGASWPALPSPACGDAPFDHQKLASGPPGPDANPLAGLLHPTVLYLCYNGVAVTNCAASYDGGRTWPVNRPTAVNLVGAVAPPEQAGVLSPCFAGQNGHPTVSYGGVVAFMRTWSCTQPILTLSTDSGLTWTNVQGPSFPGGPSDFLTTANAHSIDPEVAFTPDGTLYVLFQSWNHHAYLARTKDLGASWEGPFDVTPPGTGTTVFAALGAGSDGRIAAAFLAANATGSSVQVPEDTRWHLHIVVSSDADAEDPTFVAYQATPDGDPVQVGQIHQGGGSDPDRNLLDFIDGAVAPDGTFYVSFTDGCTVMNECAGKPAAEQTAEFRGSEGAVAWLKGWSLLDAPRDGPLPL